MIAYGIIYLLGLLLILRPHIIHKEKHFFLLWIVFSMTLSVSIRSIIGSVELSDIDQYALLMQSDQEIPYFLREFVFWFLIRFLYNITGNEIITFLILDFILFITLYKGFFLIKSAFFPKIKNTNVRYLLFGSLLFFPYALGMSNYYRQIIATAVLLYAIGSIGNKKTLQGILLFIVSVFIHNPSIIFAPLLLTFSKYTYKITAISLLLLIPTAFQFVLGSDNGFFARSSGNHIGENIANIYLLVFFIIFLINLSLDFLKPNDKQEIHYFLFVSIIIYAFILLSNVNSGSSERYAFYIFTLIFPVIGYFFEQKMRDKVTIRLIYYHLSIIPILTIYSGFLMVIA